MNSPQSGPQLEKQTLRAQARAALRLLDASALTRNNAAIRVRLQGLAVWQNAKIIFCYVSVGAEPDTRVLIEIALAAGKRVCVPRCAGAGIMDACAISALAQLEPGPFGLLQPGPGAVAVPPEVLELVVAPCLAATRGGARLGHGGGYYDRYLARVRCQVACLCHGALLCNALPGAPHDRQMDFVVTEDAVYGGVCGGQGV